MRVCMSVCRCDKEYDQIVWESGHARESAMITLDRRVAVERVPCEVCLKEIARDEAAAAEATDYVVYFCGLDCYELWRKEQAQARDDSSDPVTR